MADSSVDSSGGSKQSSSYSSSRSSSPRGLDDFSSEEEVTPSKQGNAKTKAPGSGSGTSNLKVKSQSKDVAANSSFFTTEAGKKPGMGSGAKGGQLTSKPQLSATLVESSHSSASSPRSPSISGKQKREKDNDNDNDVYSPLIGKGANDSARERKSSKTSALLKRKETAKARTTSNIKTKGTTTTTTTTTTATTVPRLKASNSSSEKVESTSSEEEERVPNASTRAKRRSYIASSVETDQQSIAAVKNAKSISSRSTAEQSEAFQKTLGMIKELKPANRCASLLSLAQSLKLLDYKEQAVYLPRLRKLASPPMSAQDRKKVIDALVCTFAGCAVDDTGSDHSHLDGEDSDADTQQAYPLGDAKALKQFEQKIKEAKSRIDDVNAPGKQRSIDSIKQVMQDVADSGDVCLELECAIGFLDALDNYQDHDKKTILSQLLDVFGDEIVATALLLGVLCKELEKAADINVSPSAMLAGFIEGDKSVIETLEKFIELQARKKPFLNVFLQRLQERSREMSTPGKNNPHRAAATMYLLMDMAAASQLPESSRCRLSMYLYFMNPTALYQALSSTRKQHGETGFDFAHRVIATAIDVQACSSLLPESADKKMEHLSSYQYRIDAANGKEKQPRLQPRGKYLRALLLDSKGDAAEVTKAVGKVFGSNASFEDKRVLLQALETTPLTDALPAYVEEFYFERADAYLNQRNPGKARHLPDLERLRTEKKPYYGTLSRIHKELPPEKVAELRKETKEAHDKALNSTLPAVHAAIMNNNVAMVKAYLDAVLDPDSGLSLVQVMELINMPHKGRSAFYRTLMRGTPDMIRTFIETILASKLNETHKVDLLLARRESDNFGAFYVAMSSRSPERVKAFMEAVLASNLLLKNKEKLLRCKKELGKGAAASRNKISEIYLNAQLYARSEAARNEAIWVSREQKITAYDKISYGARKLPSKVNPKIERDPAHLRSREEMPSLVALFDDLIDKSDLHSSSKDGLKDKLPVRKPLNQ